MQPRPSIIYTAVLSCWLSWLFGTVRADGAKPAAPESDPAETVAGSARLDEVVVREGYRTAEALRRNGDLSGALAVLRLTYDRVRTPYLLWPIAELHKVLRHPVAGLRVLAEYTLRVPAEERKSHDTKKLRAELLVQVARLRIGIDEPGALVLIDGEQRGGAPLGGPVELDPGRHKIEVRGKRTVVRDVMLWPGVESSTSLSLAETRLRGMSSSVLARWVLAGVGGAAMIGGGALWASGAACGNATCMLPTERTAGIATFAAGAGLFTASVLTLILDHRSSRGGGR